MSVKKTYQINTNRGVDLSSSPLNVAPSRASYMRNMINDGGINKKRRGWNEIANFKDKNGNELAINGIWEYVNPADSTERHLIVYAGTEFFKCSYDFSEQLSIPVEEGANVNGEKCKAYYKDGLLWIIGCGDYLVYDGTSIVRVEDSEYAYAPVTSINITTDRQIKSHEDVNLLTNKRVNKLIGANSHQNYYVLDGKINMDKPVKVDIELYLGDNDYYDNDVPLTVRLDSKVIVATDISVATESPIKMMFSNIGSSYKYKNTENIDVRFAQALYIDEAVFEAQAGCSLPHMDFYNGAELVYSTSELNLVDSPKSELDLTDKLENQKVTKMVIKAQEGKYPMYLKKIQITAKRECTGLINAIYEGSISDGRIVTSRANTPLGYGTLYSDNAEYKINADISNVNGKGKILFYENVITPIQGESNITVEYYADYERDIDLTASAVYTQGNGVDLLLVANRGNAIFYNGLDSADCEHSFGYIPVEKFITFGSDRDEITAIVPMADCVGVFKGKSFYRVGFTFNTDSETYKAEYVPQITVSTESNGCVNQYVCCEVNGDTLTFDGAGVYGIDFSAQQRCLRLRSSNISKAFEKYSRAQLESAVACEHDGRYYLFIGGDVYIGDSRFKVYESNRLDTSFDYEWWVWDNCPATVACSIGGKLYLGKENGKIAVFDKEYKDRSHERLRYSTGDFVFFIQPRGRTEFVFNEKLKITQGKRLFLKNAYSLIGEFNSVLENGMVKLRIDDLELLDLGLIYAGMQIYFEIDMRGPYDITDITAENGVWYAYVNAPSCYESETIITSVENKPYIVTENDGRYSLLEESFANASYKKEQCYLCVANGWNTEIIIRNEQNVECEYHTPVMDLGSNLCLKILNQLAITVSNETEGQVEIGYQTNNNNTFMKRNIGSAFDFNNFDFNTFAFDGAFYKTHIKRVFERNFNYILFKFASKSDSDFAVEAFTCVYSSNNKLLKGDR